MTNAQSFADVTRETLPFLRRYGRALTGSQDIGDAIASRTLEAVLGDRTRVEAASSIRVGLFAVFHQQWVNSASSGRVQETGLHLKAQQYLGQLAPNTREVLLLSTIEEMTRDQVAEIMEIMPEEARRLLGVAHADMAAAVTGRVMIIEDEAVIAMDLDSIVSDMGHQVTGVARTKAEAIELAGRDIPGLILADIQLADNSSGIDAVNDILNAYGERPVVFITAFPERLLTGERPEPAFLISKPYAEAQVRSAVSQAMFFASTETLKS